MTTMDTFYNAVVDTNSLVVKLNATTGIVERFEAKAMKVAKAAVAGKCGTLEMKFFLKKELPPSNVNSFGKMRVDIFP